jgi:hypothetical protein
VAGFEAVEGEDYVLAEFDDVPSGKFEVEVGPCLGTAARYESV